MTKQMSEALKRADRVIGGAFLLAICLAGLAGIRNAPSTEQIAGALNRTAHSVSQMSGDGRAAIGHPQDTLVHLAAAFPQIPAVASEGIANSLRAVSVPSPSMEATLIRVLQDQRCLAEAMYYEARGEGRAGEEAIAEVIFHRMHARGFPRTICGVVYQGAGLKHGCQFSFTCDGEMLQAKASGSWMRARALAARIMAGAVQLGDVTENAISFHAADVQPDWADDMERTIQIGNHVFYRAISRTKAS